MAAITFCLCLSYLSMRSIEILIDNIIDVFFLVLYLKNIDYKFINTHNMIDFQFLNYKKNTCKNINISLKSKCLFPAYFNKFNVIKTTRLIIYLCI